MEAKLMERIKEQLAGNEGLISFRFQTYHVEQDADPATTLVQQDRYPALHH